MRRAEYTPGPWTWEAGSCEWPDHNLIGGDGDSLMWWDFDLGFRFKNEANAPLIAAAPDLLEALIDALDAWETHNQSGDSMQGHWARDARAAIAKATGEASQ